MVYKNGGSTFLIRLLVDDGLLVAPTVIGSLPAGGFRVDSLAASASKFGMANSSITKHEVQRRLNKNPMGSAYPTGVLIAPGVGSAAAGSFRVGSPAV